MATISYPTRRNVFLPQLKALISIQRFNQTVAGGGGGELQVVEPTRDKDGDCKSLVARDIDGDSNFEPRRIDFSKWRMLDSRGLGITGSKLPESARFILRTLQQKGFEAYLVGGCVRDLLLKKVPKDFDVITTAALKQIKKQFRNAVIVGRRFPICMVHLNGSVVEVSSFDTVAKGEEEKKFPIPRIPKTYSEQDAIRWRNSMHRDFTINSLFYDPSINRIYDYANAIADIKSRKLRTLIPAQLSFEEDCARILRGLRLAARLNLSFSMETETAIRKLSPSIASLSKSRLMLELNYMLSYGAAEPSLCLLRRYNLLEILLPFHAAHLTQQATKQSSDATFMLMKLFSSLDKLVSCDRPAHDSLWLALLAFHLELINNPQHILVVLTFAYVLYHGKLEKGVLFARHHAGAANIYIPEISNSAESFDLSDDEISKRAVNLAAKVQASASKLSNASYLKEMTSKFSGSLDTAVVFVSQTKAKNVSAIFHIYDVKYLESFRESLDINYKSLKKGDTLEIRFAFGKILLDTMGFGVQDMRKIMPFYFLEMFGPKKFERVGVNSQTQMKTKQRDEKMHKISSAGDEFEQGRAKKQKKAVVVDKQDKGLVHRKSNVKSNMVKKNKEIQESEKHQQRGVKNLKPLHEIMTEQKKSARFVQRDDLRGRKRNLQHDKVEEEKKIAKTLSDIFK